eukprot:scaffold143075_cov112-Phaeocystis_antarctica.AAC.1
MANLACHLHLRSGGGRCVERGGERDDGVAHARVVVHDAGGGDSGGGGGGGGAGAVGCGGGKGAS